MMLSPQSIPLTAPVRESVLKRFTHPESLLRDAQIMSRNELVDYLSNIDDCSVSPLDAILRRAEDTGDPALPPPAESALLALVGASFELWQAEFPLQTEIARELRQLKLLLSQVALVDQDFCIPGAHPAHQLLDALHEAAIGWQPDLGRSGEAVTRLLQETRASLAGLEPLRYARQARAQIEAATESARRLQSRNSRMGLRAADVERARLRSVRARTIATLSINAVLASTPLPDAAGSFLRGAWYESAQLVLLKFGTESAQWQQMSAAMAQLVAVLSNQQALDSGGNADTAASTICTTLERWLLSLQHQQDAARRALGELEYLLLRALSGQALERSEQPLIAVADDNRAEQPEVQLAADIVAGQWVLLQEARAPAQRLQLVLRQDDHQQLLLCRHSGQQPRGMSFSEFNRLSASAALTLLPSGASFSRSLAAAAGVKSAPETGPATRASTPPEQPQPRQPVPPIGTPAAARTTPPATAGYTGELPLPPPGTWLGFHDVDPPLLAKLAMHDAVRKLIIFVNRKGMELRRLDEAQYLALIGEGLIDVLETSGNFRQQVERAHKRLQRHRHTGI